MNCLNPNFNDNIYLTHKMLKAIKMLANINYEIDLCGLLNPKFEKEREYLGQVNNSLWPNQKKNKNLN